MLDLDLGVVHTRFHTVLSTVTATGCTPAEATVPVTGEVLSHGTSDVQKLALRRI